MRASRYISGFQSSSHFNRSVRDTAAVDTRSRTKTIAYMRMQLRPGWLVRLACTALQSVAIA